MQDNILAFSSDTAAICIKASSGTQIHIACGRNRTAGLGAQSICCVCSQGSCRINHALEGYVWCFNSSHSQCCSVENKAITSLQRTSLNSTIAHIYNRCRKIKTARSSIARLNDICKINAAIGFNISNVNHSLIEIQTGWSRFRQAHHYNLRIFHPGCANAGCGRAIAYINDWCLQAKHLFRDNIILEIHGFGCLNVRYIDSDFVKLQRIIRCYLGSCQTSCIGAIAHIGYWCLQNHIIYSGGNIALKVDGCFCSQFTHSQAGFIHIQGCRARVLRSNTGGLKASYGATVTNVYHRCSDLEVLPCSRNGAFEINCTDSTDIFHTKGCFVKYQTIRSCNRCSRKACRCTSIANTDILAHQGQPCITINGHIPDKGNTAAGGICC